MLTDKEVAVLHFIGAYFSKNRYAPTLHEICAACAMKAASSASVIVTGLIARGYLTRDPGTPRSLQLTARAPSIDEASAWEALEQWAALNNLLMQQRGTIRKLRAQVLAYKRSQPVLQAAKDVKEAEERARDAEAREQQMRQAFIQNQRDVETTANELAAVTNTLNLMRNKQSKLTTDAEDVRQDNAYYQGLLGSIEGLMKQDGYVLVQLREYVEMLRRAALEGVR